MLKNNYQLILVEGLPGTGKTTISKYIYSILNKQGIKAELMLEEDPRIPSNFDHIAGIRKSEYANLLIDKVQISLAILAETKEYIFINLRNCKEEHLNQLKNYDIGDEYNKYISVQEYARCTLEMWENWVQKFNHEVVHVLDCAFMQCPINEMVFRGATDIEIKEYISGITKIIKPLNPLCVYLRRENAKESIEFASNAKGSGWSLRIKEMLTNLGCPDLFERRFNLESKLLSQITNIICNIKEYDWTDAEQKISSILGSMD